MSTDQYAVVGSPIAHSKSPQIHATFAQQTQQQLEYQAIEIPENDFSARVRELIDQGYRGINITVPHKLNAFRFANILSQRALRAGAVNTLSFIDGQTRGDNTDGIGLVTDIRDNHNIPLSDQRILILGAGGAVRGILAPLLSEQPAHIHIANRSPDKAEHLAQAFGDIGQISASGFKPVSGPYDLIINATAAGLQGETPDIDPSCIGPKTACYDMLYSQQATTFQAWARQTGQQQGHDTRAIDGLGMLVEQAAEAFFVWRGVRPNTQGVIQQLRQKT